MERFLVVAVAFALVVNLCALTYGLGGLIVADLESPPARSLAHAPEGTR